MSIAELTTTDERTQGVPLAPEIAALLSRVRTRIRRYLWVEGVAALVLLAIVAFWITLVFDWFFEPPVFVRVVMQGVVLVAALIVAYRLLADRLRVRLTDRSLAILLERKYPEFRDSLLTAVEFSESSSCGSVYERQMVATAVDDAVSRVGIVDLDELFNPAPLARNVLIAGALGFAAFGFAMFEPRSVETWARRVLTLSNELWPRYTRLVIDGFDDGSIKVARGSDVELVVKADTTMRVPRTVRLQYHTDEGLRGRATMMQRGQAIAGRDSFQQFSYTFSGILSPIEFDVIGGDQRRRGLRIEVVDSPAVTGMSLHCEYPEYMRREAREIPVTGVMHIPQGTKVSVHFETNKDMVEVNISDSMASNQADPTTGEAMKSASIRAADADSKRRFRYDLGTLMSDHTVLVSLLDSDRIRNREPNRLIVTAVADEVPALDIRLRGIGSAITPQAQIPVVGQMKDDYGIAKAWFEFAVDGQPPAQADLSRPPQENTEITVEEAFDVRPRGLTPGQKVQLSIKAADTFALGDTPQTGTSSAFQLDVVTAEDLRSMLEARELNLRRRFEQLISEVAESRDSLARLAPREGEPKPADSNAADDAAGGKAEAANGTTAATPADQAKAGREEGLDETDSESNAQTAAERELARQRLRVEQVLQNSRKNADETLGVAAAFDDIHDELVNNRVDTEELKSRLKQGIAEPLKKLAGQSFAELESRLGELQKNLPDPAERANRLTAAQQQVDSILFEMQVVLNKMIELETFNEVVDLLRSIIDSQGGLNEKTLDTRKTKLRDLLE